MGSNNKSSLTVLGLGLVLALLLVAAVGLVESAPSCGGIYSHPEGETCFDIITKFQLTADFFAATNPNLDCDDIFVANGFAFPARLN